MAPKVTGSIPVGHRQLGWSNGSLSVSSAEDIGSSPIPDFLFWNVIKDI